MITYDYKFLYMIIYICLCVSNHPVFFLSKTNTLVLGGALLVCVVHPTWWWPPPKKMVYKFYINPNELTASVCVCIYIYLYMHIYIYISTMNPFAIKNNLSILICHHVSWNSCFCFQFLISSWWGRYPRAFIIFIPLGISNIFHHIASKHMEETAAFPQILHLQLEKNAPSIWARLRRAWSRWPPRRLPLSPPVRWARPNQPGAPRFTAILIRFWSLILIENRWFYCGQIIISIHSCWSSPFLVGKSTIYNCQKLC